MVPRWGILLLQLGTPASCTYRRLWRFLTDFLTDKRVIHLPWPIRMILVYGIIVPLRLHKVLQAYRSIWTEKGSPLWALSGSLQEKLQAELNERSPGLCQVHVAMRYGTLKEGMASIPEALDQCAAQGIERLWVLPLYPQYASSSSGSALEEVYRWMARQWAMPQAVVLRDYMEEPLFSAFIHAQKTVYQEYLANILGEKTGSELRIDHWLFTYHGLPCSHIEKGDPYVSHCEKTTLALAEALNLVSGAYTMSFQSRLGRTPWVRPYTDEILDELYAQGIRHLVVACPSFISDCLETIEEIGDRAEEQWKELGGLSFYRMPCLNDHPVFVQTLAHHFMTYVANQKRHDSVESDLPLQ